MTVSRFRAASQGRDEIAQELIRAKTDADMPNGTGQTALTIAAGKPKEPPRS